VTSNPGLDRPGSAKTVTLSARDSADLHNPNIRPEKRMTLEAFIRNNKNYGKEIRCGFLFLPRPALYMPHQGIGGVHSLR
jgi:hypothetical protein